MAGRCTSLVVAACGAAIAVGCREVPQAPPETPPFESSFTTFLVDLGFNVDYGAGFSTPNVVIEAGTTVNVVYGYNDGGLIKYAGCPAYCGDSTSWRHETEIDTVYGSAYDPSAAVTPAGLHVAFSFFPGGGGRSFLGYAFCPGACDHRGNWRLAGIDTVWKRAQSPAIAADPTGGVHVIYGALTLFRTFVLRYAECQASCVDPARWQAVDLETLSGPISYNFGERQATLLADSSGRLHALYAPDGAARVRYATCASSCTNTASWQFAVVEEGTIFSSLSLARDGGGTLHAAYVAYTNSAAEVRYAVCSSDCQSDGGWMRGVLARPVYWDGQQAVALATGGGRLWLSFIHLADSTTVADSAGIALAVCTTVCTDSTRWQTTIVHRFGYSTPQVVGLGVDGEGKVFLPHTYWGLFYVTGMK